MEEPFVSRNILRILLWRQASRMIRLHGSRIWRWQLPRPGSRPATEVNEGVRGMVPSFKQGGASAVLRKSCEDSGKPPSLKAEQVELGGLRMGPGWDLEKISSLISWLQLVL